MSCGLVVTLCGLLLQFTGKFLKMLAFGTVEYFSLVCDGVLTIEELEVIATIMC